MNKNNNDTANTIVSTRYQEASIKFRDAWLEYVGREAVVKYEIINMVTILEQEGFSRTQAIQRIIDDHKDLKGFSRASVYRELPDEMKKPNRQKELRRSGQAEADVVYKDSDVSFETSESINKTSKALEGFRQQKGTKMMNEAIDSVYDLEDESNSTAEPHVIYDNPQKIIQQHEQRIIQQEKELDTWQVKYEELETKYEQVITPFEVRQTAIVKDQELPFIVKVDPYKRSIDFEVDQKEVKKLNRF